MALFKLLERAVITLKPSSKETLKSSNKRDSKKWLKPINLLEKSQPLMYIQGPSCLPPSLEILLYIATGSGGSRVSTLHTSVPWREPLLSTHKLKVCSHAWKINGIEYKRVVLNSYGGVIGAGSPRFTAPLYRVTVIVT